MYFLYAFYISYVVMWSYYHCRKVDSCNILYIPFIVDEYNYLSLRYGFYLIEKWVGFFVM